MRTKLLNISVGLALALTVVACGNGGGDLSSSDAVVTTEVSVFDNSFDPTVVEVAAGDTITWTWEGKAPHDVDGDGFASEVQTEGTFQHTFDQPGEFQYICNIHSGMKGLVVVTGP